MKKTFVPRYFKRTLILCIIFAFVSVAFGFNGRLDFAKKGDEAHTYLNDIVIDEKLVDFMVLVESSNNTLAHKKKTGARGPMQITPLAWKDLVRHFPAQYKNLNYRKHIFTHHIGKKAGRDYLVILKNYLRIKGIPVTLENLLAAYNWGIGNLAKFGLARAPRATRRFIEQIKNSFEG